MTSLELAHHDGRRILAMRVNAPGSSDLVEHTIRHFLEPQEAWQRLEPSIALSPTDARAGIAAAGWSIAGFSSYSREADRRVNDVSWWDDPRAAAIQRIHDDGYYPRYVVLTQLAGRFTAPGSHWQRDARSGHYWASVEGCIVAGDLVGKTSFQMISAYRSAVIRDTGRTVPLGTLADKLGARCQELRRLASLPQEPIR